MYSLSQAAKAVGRSKGAISDAIRKGKISAEKDAHGQWQIDPAELHRVYPPASPQTAQSDTGLLDAGQGVGRGEASHSGEQSELVRTLQAALEDARRERDHWRVMAERLAIAGPPQEAQKQAATPRKGWWAKLVGRG